MLFLINSSNSCSKIRIDDSAAGFDFLFNILYIVLLGIEQLNLDIFIGEVSLNFIDYYLFFSFFKVSLFSEINNPASVRKVPNIAIGVIFSLSIRAEKATVITGTA